MKFITILLLAVTFVSAVEKETITLPEAKVANLKKVGNECATEHSVDAALVSGIADGTIPRNEAHNKFLFCFGIKLGIITEDGHGKVEKLVEYVGNNPLAEDFRKVITKCNEISKENPIATLVALHSCYSETSPVKFSLGG